MLFVIAFVPLWCECIELVSLVCLLVAQRSAGGCLGSTHQLAAGAQSSGTQLFSLLH